MSRSTANCLGQVLLSVAVVVCASAQQAPVPGMAGTPGQAKTSRGRVAVPEYTTSPTWSSGNFVYDGSGNITAIGADSYVYDELGRLRSAAANGNGSSYTEAYAYDGFGNMTSRTTSLYGGGGLTIPVLPASNQISGFTYDVAGNVKADDRWAYTWDPFNMMAEIGGQGSDNIYVYSATDERIGTKDVIHNGWTWSLRGVDGKVLREFKSQDVANAPWTWVEDYVYRDGQLVGADLPADQGGRRHIHVDHLGTPRLVTNDYGQGISRHDYTPYGIEVTSNQQDTSRGYNREDPLKFTGHERDFDGPVYDNGSSYFDYMHARYYGATGGRFASVDPDLDLKSAPGQPQLWNRYTYVLNNPIRDVDPDGRCGWGFLGGPIGCALEAYVRERGPQVVDAVKGMGKNATAKERLLGAGVLVISAADIASNFVAPEEGAAVEGGTKLLSAAKLMDHHLLPQQFANFFKSAGIDIHAFTVTLDEGTHLRGVHGSGLGDVPGKWNSVWRGWVEGHPNASAKEIYQQLGRMIDEFHLTNLEIHTYRQ